MAQKIRIDITDAAGNKVGSGPIMSAPTLTVVRAFDGAGSITISLPGTEERAVELATNERRARAFIQDDRGVARYVGAGVLRTISVSGGSGAWSLRATGPDLFDELRRVSVLIRREYRECELGEVISDLLLLAGWTCTVDADIASQLVTVRFDGESVLKALQQLASNYGLHFREGLEPRTVEFGAFGVPTDFVATSGRSVGRQIADETKLLVVTKISVKRDTSGLVNWIMPIGAGEGLAGLTLEKSTRTGPYPIQQMFGPDGSILYYITDTDSVVEYGLSQKIGTFKDITPIDNTAIGIERAANALYDAAVAYLQRYARRLDTYTLTVTKVAGTVRPGDKIRLVYRGVVTDEQGKPTNFLAVNELLWVMKVTETFGRGAGEMTLDVATVDRHEDDVAKIVVGAIESINLRNLKIQPYPNTFAYVYPRELDETHVAEIPLSLTDGVLYLDRCRLTLKTRPFRATAKATGAAAQVVGTTEQAAAVVGSTSKGGGSVASSSAGGGQTTSGGGATTSSGGGNHNHKVLALTSVVGFPATSIRPYLGRNSDGGAFLYVKLETNNDQDLWTESSSGDHTHTVGNHTHTVANHSHNVTIPAHSHEITIPAHSHGITIPAHEHEITYGIVDDTAYPDTVRLSVNGQDVTAALGGPWGVGGTPINTQIDITEQILGAVGGLRQQHIITFSCDGGQGQAEVTVECKVTVQSLQQV